MAEPWETITKVNSVSLDPNDKVLFNRGDTFVGQLTPTDSGTAGNPITYGAYGSGDRPIFNGIASNTFYINSANYNNIRLENIDFSGSDGTKATFQCFDTHDIYVYNCIIRDSGVDKAGVYIQSNGVNHPYNITFDTCESYDNSTQGFLCTDVDGHDILFYNCIAHDNGHTPSADHGFYVAGGTTVDYCTAYNNYHAGFKENDNEVESFYYPIVRNCTSYNNNVGLVCTHKNAKFYNNLVYSNIDYNLVLHENSWGGYKIYFNTFVNSTDTANRSIYIVGLSPNSIIKSNTFIQDFAVVTRGVWLATPTLANVAANYDIDYNIYYTDGNAANVAFGYSPEYGTTSWSEWLEGTGMDTHSTFLGSVPGFVTRYTNLHPANAGNLDGHDGVAITGYELDKDGNIRADPPNCGCYEESTA